MESDFVQTKEYTYSTVMELFGCKIFMSEIDYIFCPFNIIAKHYII